MPLPQRAAVAALLLSVTFEAAQADAHPYPSTPPWTLMMVEAADPASQPIRVTVRQPADAQHPGDFVVEYLTTKAVLSEATLRQLPPLWLDTLGITTVPYGLFGTVLRISALAGARPDRRLGPEVGSSATHTVEVLFNPRTGKLEMVRFAPLVRDGSPAAWRVVSP
jgi:hypothetical protein